MSSTIKIKNSSTAGAIPTSSDLVQGELAVNVTDKTIFTENASGTVVELGKNYTGFKNRIINGAMAIDQRNAGASVTATSTGSGIYYLDRWSVGVSQASKLSVQQNAGSVTPPRGFKNYIGVTSLSSYSVVTADYFYLTQNLEGLNVYDLGFGSSSASSVTLSFWVRSSLTGTFGGSLQNNAYDRSYPFSYTISSANTWEQKTVTISGDTSGTWLTTNGVGLRLKFALGYGATYGNGTAGAWVGSDLESVTGATSVVGTNGATFYITGVQLEKGSTATSFDYRPYGTELSLCQRYYFKTYNQDVKPTSVSTPGAVTNTLQATCNYPGVYCAYKQTMRTTPSTLYAFNPVTGSSSTIRGDATDYAYNVFASGANGVLVYVNNTSTSVNTFLYAHVVAEAEL